MLQAEAIRRERPFPPKLPADSRLFSVPKFLILDRDLELAGIPKRDERGRTVDVHALRHTFGTHLSKAGVAPRVAQAAMRHSTINLTMNVYTDPELLDVAAAMEKLPALPLTGAPKREEPIATACGGATGGGDPVALDVALVPGATRRPETIPDKMAGGRETVKEAPADAVSSFPVTRKNPPTAVSGLIPPQGGLRGVRVLWSG